MLFEISASFSSTVVREFQTLFFLSCVRALLFLCVRVCGSEILWRKCTEACEQAKSQATERDRTGSTDAYITALLRGTVFDMSHSNVLHQLPTLTPVHNPCSTCIRLARSKWGHILVSSEVSAKLLQYVCLMRTLDLFRPMVCKLISVWINI